MTSSICAVLLMSLIVIYLLPSSTSENSYNSHRSLPIMYFPDDCAATTVSGFTEGLIISHRSDRYQPNIACTIYISLRSVEPVRFTFDYIDLSETSLGDCEDYLQFYAGDVNGDWTAIGQQICGRTLPEDIISHSTNISVVFKTNGVDEGTGFRFRFSRHKQPTAMCVPGRSCTYQDGEGQVPSSNESRISREERGGAGVLVILSIIALIVVLLRRSHETQRR